MLCELISTVLASEGMEVHTASVSGDALARLRKEKFDAVFLDVHMPAPSGIELAQAMRAGGFNVKTPIVMITGDGDPSVLRRGFESGANFFLFKPVDRRGLLRLARATQGSIQHEKRRFQRVAVRCKALVESGGDRLQGETLDISMGGVLVEAASIFDVGAKVDLQLHIGGPKPLGARGRVVRVQDNRMGIVLDNLGAAESARLQEFLLPHILSAIEQQSLALQRGA
jgi:CheY-like chemotaxis protein